MERSAYLSHLLKSGKVILSDTKLPASREKREKIVKNSQEPPDSDPHKAFVKKTITDKPKKEDVVKDLERFIKEAEAKL
jgi:DNA polymerase III epsilon subunit-like protein